MRCLVPNPLFLGVCFTGSVVMSDARERTYGSDLYGDNGGGICD
jgi:hypothetical protein